MKPIDLVSEVKLTTCHCLCLNGINLCCMTSINGAVDNRSWKPHAKRKHFNVAEFMEPSQTLMLSSQQRLAVYQFLTGNDLLLCCYFDSSSCIYYVHYEISLSPSLPLSPSVLLNVSLPPSLSLFPSLFSEGIEPFSKQYMSPSVLKRLLDQDIVRLLSREDYVHDDDALYSAGSPASFFALIVEGCVQVTIGSDGMEFQSRSFSHFGTQALLNTLEDPPAEYVPDYTVRPTMDCLVVIITQRQYTAARNATLFGKEKKAGDEGSEGGGGGEGGGALHRTWDRNSVDKADVFFKHEWEMAKTHDLENSLVTKSGLTPIARLFKKKSNSKQNAKSDCRGLLTLSSTESEAGSSDSSSASGRKKIQVDVSMEEAGNFTGGGGSVQFRTKGDAPPIIESYPSSPQRPCSAYQTTQV